VTNQILLAVAFVVRLAATALCSRAPAAAQRPEARCGHRREQAHKAVPGDSPAEHLGQVIELTIVHGSPPSWQYRSAPYHH
jgi:hypothetical protein